VSAHREPGRHRKRGRFTESGPEARDDEPGADLGAKPPYRTPLPEPDEPFQSPMSVAGIGPGGEPYRGGHSPSEQNPAADPGGDPALYDNE
jgi:hypothetical protein